MGEKKELKALNRLNSERIMIEIARHIEAGVPYIDAVVEYATKNELVFSILKSIDSKSHLTAILYKIIS